MQPFNPESEFSALHQNLKEELNFESGQRRPSINLLAKYADKILEVVNEWQSLNYHMQMEVVSAKQSLEIFNADLQSDLEIYEDKKYTAVWNEKYLRLKSIQNHFLKSYLQKQEKIS
ncbi:MAG TPA: hypothetical protein VGB44_00445 [Flavobacterium sp.]|jgi:hypothetical protein